MLLEKMYNDFITNTGLTDGVYKAVFINIGEILETLQNIQFHSLTYTTGNGDKHPTDFNSKQVPGYVIEMIFNLFDRFYSLPEKSSVELSLSYKDTLYTIVDTNGIVTVPEELRFFSENKLINFFVVDNKTYDIFDEFDKLFSFVYKKAGFTRDTRSIIPELKKAFEKEHALVEAIDSGIDNNSAEVSQAMLAKIKQNRVDAIEQLTEIENNYEKLLQSKNSLLLCLKSKESLYAEKNSLQIEYDSIKESLEEYRSKIIKVEKTLEEIDTSLSGLELGDDEIEFLKDKKVRFIDNKNSLLSIFQDIKNNLEELSMRMKQIDGKLEKVGSITDNDRLTLESQLQDLDHEKDRLTSIIAASEAEITKLKSQFGTELSTLSNAAYPVDKSIIVKQLSQPSQPISVITVMNYIKNYFAYVTHSIALSLVDQFPNYNPNELQIIAARLTLVKGFNLYFKHVFSSFMFADDRYERVIKIVKG